MATETKESEFVKNLKGNAVFQMSLSSKELFHSNFLAWLAEDKKMRPLFNLVMQKAFGMTGFEYNEEEMMVMREYNHFDFCICRRLKNWKYKHEEFSDDEEEYIPGHILLVLENKFKSLPYAQQLEDYARKAQELNAIAWASEFRQLSAENRLRLFNNAIKRPKVCSLKNKKGQTLELKEKEVWRTDKLPNKWRDIFEKDIREASDTKYVLLSLGKPNFELEGWRNVSYDEYVACLRSCLEKKSLLSAFNYDIIKHYVDFVSVFSSHLTERLRTVTDSSETWDVLTRYEEFRQIRCHDIWQKLVMHKCAQMLAEKLEPLCKEFEITDNIDFCSSDNHIFDDIKAGKTNKLYIGVNYFHGEALIELKHAFSLTKDNKCTLVLQQQGAASLSIGFVIEGKTYNEQWILDNIKAIAGENAVKEELHAYNKGKPCGYYYHHLNGTLTINATLDKMVELMWTFLKIPLPRKFPS